MSEPVPEEPLIGWWRLADARESWRDAPIDDGDLARLLQVAYEMCADYQAPPTGGRLPERFREAQLLQTAACWAAERTGPGDLLGADGATVRVYPMGAQVKALLRPDDGLPVIG